MSGTPRTDAKCRETEYRPAVQHAHCGWKLARNLERELNEALARAEKSETALTGLMATWSAQCDQLQKAEKERDEAIAELARLTTLRPISEYQGRSKSEQQVVFHYKPSSFRTPTSTEYHPSSIGWTPLPEVKEPT